MIGTAARFAAFSAIETRHVFMTSTSLRVIHAQTPDTSANIMEVKKNNMSHSPSGICRKSKITKLAK